MTDADRARGLLIDARKRISENQNTFICAALMDAENDRPDYERASLSLRSWIMYMLTPYSTYDNWIWYEHKQLWLGLLVFELNEKAREGRLAWIGWMITQDLGKIVRKYNR